MPVLVFQPGTLDEPTLTPQHKISGISFTPGLVNYSRQRRGKPEGYVLTQQGLESEAPHCYIRANTRRLISSVCHTTQLTARLSGVELPAHRDTASLQTEPGPRKAGSAAFPPWIGTKAQRAVGAALVGARGIVRRPATRPTRGLSTRHVLISSYEKFISSPS